jgi:hypothetical protein
MALNYPNPAQELSLCEPFSTVFGCNQMFGNSTYMSRVPGVPLFTQNINSHWNPNTTFILNQAAWTNPPPDQFGTGSPYYNNYRYRRTPTENMALERIFRIKESKSLMIRAELNNVFNRTFIPAPFNQMLFPQTKVGGSILYGFGYATNWINTGGQRNGQLVARFQF